MRHVASEGGAPRPVGASRNALAAVLLTVLIDTIGFGIVIPVLPQLIVELTGDSLALATRDGGYLLVTYAVMQFFFGPVMGSLSDRFGRRVVILASLAAFGTDYLVMALAPTLAWLFVGRAVAGMSGAVYAAANAFIADITPAGDRAKSFGLVGAMFGLGFILGPAMGGLLGELGPRAPFFASALLAFLNLIYAFLVLPETLPPERRRPFVLRRANPFGTFASLARRGGVLGLAAAMFLWQLAHQVYPSTWSFFTKIRFGWSEAEIGASLALVGVTMAVVQGGLTGRLVGRWGERRAAFLGLTVGTLAFVAYGLAMRSWMLYGIILFAALQGLVYPSMNALLSRRVSEDQQGELQGGIASLYSLATIIGPLVMTQALSRFSAADARVHLPGAAFFLAAALAVVSGWMLARSLPGRPARVGTDSDLT
ncbi:MAG: TCR/Tet family MFS transporter [Gemmatimonadota bacterium]